MLRLRNFEEAFDLFPDEVTKLVGLFGYIVNLEKKKESLKNNGSIYLGKAAIEAVSNNEDVDSLTTKQNKLLKVLWKQMISFNKEYHQSTGKYLINKVEIVDENTYCQLYEELTMVI